MITDNKKHQNLIELENLVTRILNIQTNVAYQNNKKFSFKMSWTKGEATIEKDNKKFKDYYIFKVYILDKTNIIQNTIPLVEAFYPVQALVNSNKLYENALENFLSHSISHLALNKLNEYEYNKSKTIDELIEDNKPKEQSKLISLKSDIISPSSNLIL